MTNANHDFSLIPGGDLVSKGLYDIEQGTLSEESLLVLIASPRLRGNGIKISPVDEPTEAYELTLYDMIDARLGDAAHSAYNSLISRMVSFSNAYDLVRRKEKSLAKQ